jgi:hypothetical protein
VSVEAVIEHGTYAAYQRHKREGVPPCEQCRQANTRYQRRFLAFRPEVREAGRARHRERSRALERLAREYPKRFQELVEEERAAEA